MSSIVQKRMLRVLVVDDSAVVRAFLTALLEAEPDMVVAGIAKSGEEAVTKVAELKPDVATMDIRMPGIGGLAAIRLIMRETPLPIIVVSGQTDTDEVTATFQAIEAGAVAFLPRPRGVGHQAHPTEAKRFIRTVRTMSEVCVVRRWTPASVAKPHPQPTLAPRARRAEIVALGASTGGPVVLATILSRISQRVAVPVVIVQHMAEGFIGGFVEWLEKAAKFPVRIAEDGEPLLAGRAYVAPDRRHLTVRRGFVQLLDDLPDSGLRPSIGRLFASIGQSYGDRAFAALLTGMGADGARELADLRALGALTAIQSVESCVVSGMPGAAAKLGAHLWSGDPLRIAELITIHGGSTS